MSKSRVVILLLFILQGCASAYRPMQLRTTYKMQKWHDLFSTNLDYFQNRAYWHNPSRKKFRGRYLLLIENSSFDDSYSIFLDRAHLTDGESKISATCSHGKPELLILSPGAAVKVHCEFSKLEGKKKDQNWSLKLPYRSAKNSGSISYLYRIKREDYR